MKKLTLVILITSSIFGYSQERCSTDMYTDLLEAKYPEYAVQRQKVNSQTQKWIKNNPIISNKAITTIPVVVHIVWNTAPENISDAQIFSQMDVLNADFRRTNSDAINTPSVWQSVATDSEIDFCLATTDPNGVATTGITRTQTSQTSFSINGSDMKSSSSGGIDPWDQDDYLNIWVCDLSGGILGYATPPSNFNNPEDGVVIGYKYFGTIGTVQSPYNKGRTATHEVGHWLNLDHIWGGGGNCGNDNVSDTPTQEEENYSCPSFPHNANSCNTSNSSGDMFMNYMDYTNDACMNMFTSGQKTRMISAINQYRNNLLSHNLCSGVAPNASWNCINGACVDPANGNGTYSNYNNCVNSCNCLGISLPLYEGFQNSSLPANWIIENSDGDKTWELTNAAGYNSSGSIYINNADYGANGEYDDLISPTLNFSSLSSASLEFDYAYSLWTDPTSSQVWSDTLIILISSDCGVSWQSIWEKAGLDLVTTSPIYNEFSWTPSSNNDWSSEVINLNNYINQDDVLIKFRNVNQFENNLYLDNINIKSSPNTVEEVKIEHIIYPNPTNSYINIEITSSKFNNIELYVSNSIGQTVYSESINSNRERIITINLNDFSEGIYFVNLITSTGELYTKQISYLK
jgi:hypothetical protein